MSIDNNLNQTLSNISQTYSISPQSVGVGFFFGGDKARAQAKEAFKYWRFSQGINLVVVQDRDGEALMGTLDDPSSGRTDVTQQDRLTNPLLSLPMQYRCAKMNTDTSIPYARMQQWQSAEFNKNYIEQTQKRLGVDRLIVGWNGTSDTATQTDPIADPFLKDIAKGWIQVMREQYPRNVIDSEMIVGKWSYEEAEKVQGVGLVDGYKCIDAAVLDMINLIPPLFRDNLVCIIGDEVIFNEKYRIYNAGEFYAEKHATRDTFEIFAGIPRVECVGFPSNAIVVTSLDNLSLYIKDGSSFRQAQNVPQRECSRDYQTHEIAYVVENMRKFAAMTNIKSTSSSGDEIIFDEATLNLESLRANAERAAREGVDK